MKFEIEALATGLFRVHVSDDESESREYQVTRAVVVRIHRAITAALSDDAKPPFIPVGPDN